MKKFIGTLITLTAIGVAMRVINQSIVFLVKNINCRKFYYSSSNVFVNFFRASSIELG